jgi:hypothetical protein
MRAVLRVIGEEERRAHVPLVCLAAGIFPEGVMEAAEVGKIGNVGNQALHAGVKRRLLLLIIESLRSNSREISARTLIR